MEAPRERRETARNRSPHTPEHRAKLSRANLGKKRTPQQRANMRAAWVLRKANTEVIANMRAAWVLRKERHRESGVPIKRSPQQRANMRAAWALRRARLERERALAEQANHGRGPTDDGAGERG